MGERVAKLGLEVHITELDAPYQGIKSHIDVEFQDDDSLSNTSGKNTQERQSEYDQERQQGHVYKELLSTCLRLPSCTGFQIWGFTDRYTWIGTEFHGLPFDECFRPKFAYCGMVNALKQ